MEQVQSIFHSFATIDGRKFFSLFFQYNYKYGLTPVGSMCIPLREVKNTIFLYRWPLSVVYPLPFWILIFLLVSKKKSFTSANFHLAPSKRSSFNWVLYTWPQRRICIYISIGEHIILSMERDLSSLCLLRHSREITSVFVDLMMMLPLWTQKVVQDVAGFDCKLCQRFMLPLSLSTFNQRHRWERSKSALKSECNHIYATVLSSVAIFITVDQ